MSSKVEFIYLSQEDVRATGINMKEVLEIIEKVLALHDEGKVNLPSKSFSTWGKGRGAGSMQCRPTWEGTLRFAE